MLLLRNTFVAIATMVLFAFSSPSTMAEKAPIDPLQYASECSNEIRVVYNDGVNDMQALVEQAIAKLDGQYAMNASRSEMIRVASRCIARLEQTSNKASNKIQRMIDRAELKLGKVGAPNEIVGIVSKHEINVHHMRDEVLDQAIFQIVSHLDELMHQPTGAE